MSQWATDDPHILLARCRAILAQWDTAEYKALADATPAYLSTLGRADVEREIRMLEREIAGGAK